MGFKLTILFLNGRRMGDAEFTPGFTSYHHRLQYQTYDVTDLLAAKDNIVGALLGEGWYSGVLGDGDAWSNRPNHYGDHTAFLMHLEISYQDGTSDRIVSDGSWTSSSSPILMSGIYAGESYDARLEQPGWNRPGFDDSQWRAVKVTTADAEPLVAQSGPPVRKLERIVPKSITRTVAETIVDMGQNMVGWVRLSVQGPRGTTVTLRHGEALDANGNLYTKNLGTAQQIIHYTLKGEGVEVYEPHFTFQGFRYVSVEGYPGSLTPRNIAGIVVHSDLNPTGKFETSNALLNQLQHNIIWGQKGNFVDIPTDCPQRDERLGWTGDAQVFAPTAAFNADVAGFFTKWLKDLSADQLANGSVPWVVPDVLRGSPVPDSMGKKADGVAGWGDAAIVIPWTLYLAYGDRAILQAQYESMAHWVGYERQRAGAKLIWDGDFQFGDNAAVDASTNTDLIATAYFAHSADLLSQAAQVLGRTQDAARYAGLFLNIRNAFNRTFVTPDAKVGLGTQAAYVLALQFGLLPEALRAAAAKHLVENIRTQGHLTTGFIGTPGLLFALSESGYLKDAYQLLLQDNNPSWLYAIKHGATTMWESWDGIEPDGSFHDPEVNSFNHYAYGAVGEWMYQVIAGINIDPTAPGYKHILIRPQPGGGLTSASATHLTPYGQVSSSWREEGRMFHLSVEIPPNTTATITLPSAGKGKLLENGEAVAASEGISAVRQVGSERIVDVGSGSYKFRYLTSD